MTQAPRLSCIIPAYNEAARISAVLATVIAHPLLDEVIVVDDASTDGTADIAAATGVRVIRLHPNRGKTGALAAGIAAATSSHLLFLDSDLLGLTAADVTALAQPVIDGRAEVSISLRGNTPRLWRMIGLDYISGERVFPRDMVQDRLDSLLALPKFGFEVYLNSLWIERQVSVAVVRWPGVASPSKAAKRGGAWAGIKADAAMMRDIFRTVTPMTTLTQIRALRTRIAPL